MALNHRQYLRRAYSAASMSLDPRTRNGAVLVDPKHERVVATGCNKFPADVRTTDERLERPVKYQYIEHAERNAIYSAAADGIATRGLVIYSPWFPCTECAKAIIQSGISMVVSHKAKAYADTDHWSDSIQFANSLFDEAGVVRYYVEEELGMYTLFNGEKITV